MVLSGLPDIVANLNVIHQTGRDHFSEVETTGRVILEKNPNASRYHPFAYLGADSLRQAASAANVIVSRAGATAIAEIALWHRPAILIPIPESISHDQRTNAYAYAHTGAAVVLEEENMTPHVLASEARRIGTDPALAAHMADKGISFAMPDAARIIANELLQIAVSHSGSIAIEKAPDTLMPK
jgi:UDP-N-acetylglucosamine--N-acetylmuramyl-(pentapeptide) pyrophosphoryl-undecaprenol N-acetylglucosamine transferase